MFHTKNGVAAIKELVSSGGVMAVSVGETDTFFVGDPKELIELGYSDCRESTVTAIHAAIGKWSLNAINMELGAAGHYSQHNDITEAREALVSMLTNCWVSDEQAEQYAYKTDSEHGVIVARNFAEAKLMLRDMLTAAAIDDGGWGWVDDVDGTRYEIGNRD